MAGAREGGARGGVKGWMNIPKVKLDPQNINLGPDVAGRMRKPAMENPWFMLHEQPPYELEIDRAAIEQYNKKKKPAHRIDTSLIPEPFIGNPKMAKLVLLNLNPGWDAYDAESHTNPNFKAAMLRNLHHESQNYPFYPLNPSFECTPCGKWWLKLTKKLIEGCDRISVSQRLLVIEWFPYHSMKSALPKRIVCESQRYSCHLAKEMQAKGALLVLLRSRAHWAICKEEFSQLPVPHSTQNPVITPGNFGEDLFKCMKQAVCEE
jgi:hypothetical protein